jgi:hypothetical protein
MSPDPLPPPGEDPPAKRWLQTAIAAVLGTGLLILAFFFAVFAVAAAALLVSVLAARWWWISRRARGAAKDSEAVVEGEYRVVQRDGAESGVSGRKPTDGS